MAGKFHKDEAEKLLVACHRRCAVCHRFCGSKIELDHMHPGGEGGDNAIENAIPLCFECHAEVHAYNDKHPRGRKFSAEELRGHKEQWLAICRERPDALIATAREVEVGPLNALIDELEFNRVICNTHRTRADTVGGFFVDAQFRRAIAAGAVSMLGTSVKEALLAAYAIMAQANGFKTRVAFDVSSQFGSDVAANDAVEIAAGLIDHAHRELLGFLYPEDEGRG